MRLHYDGSPSHERALAQMHWLLGVVLTTLGRNATDVKRRFNADYETFERSPAAWSSSWPFAAREYVSLGDA